MIRVVASVPYADLTLPFLRWLAMRMGVGFQLRYGDQWTKLDAMSSPELLLDADVVPVLSAITDADCALLRTTCAAIDQGIPTCPGWFLRFCRENYVSLPRGTPFYNSGVVGMMPEDAEKLRRTVRDIGRPRMPMKDQAIFNLAIHREVIAVNTLPPELNMILDQPAKLRHFAGDQKHLIEPFIAGLLDGKRNTLRN